MVTVWSPVYILVYMGILKKDVVGNEVVNDAHRRAESMCRSCWKWKKITFQVWVIVLICSADFSFRRLLFCLNTCCDAPRAVLVKEALS